MRHKRMSLKNQECSQDNQEKIQIVTSHACLPGESSYFEFKGTGSIENGAGKVKINQKQLSQNTRTCFQSAPVDGSLNTEVIDTFKEGTLVGNAKITLSNGNKIVTTLGKGIISGFKRTWSANGKLREFEFVSESQQRPKWINSHDKYLFYNINTFPDEENTVIILMNTNENILAGTYLPHAELVENLHEAKIEITSKSDNCMLSLEWTKLGKISYMDSF